MNKIDWKAKLTSRKLWAAVIAFVATLLVAIFKEEIPGEVADLISKGVIALCVYIFGEAGVDIARIIWTKAATLVNETMAAEPETNNDYPAATAGGTLPDVYIETDAGGIVKATPREPETSGETDNGGAEVESDEEKPPDTGGEHT